MQGTTRSGKGPNDAATDPHEVGLDTSLDFLNTFAMSKGSMVERLPTAEAAIQWMADRGALDETDPVTLLTEVASDDTAAAATLARVRRVRAALREVADAVIDRRPADRRSVATVNQALRCRSEFELEPSSEGVRVNDRCAADPISDALAHLAEPIVRTLAEGRPERLHQCANPTCGWVFYDNSPTARRRWCEMSSCGNNAKAARHRQRILMIDTRVTSESAAPN
ncbi:MAG TPA: CGNR zinc finger domain-containing protein [Candidatus Limnocylindrales bacterium]